jgi:hypothetical protein
MQRSLQLGACSAAIVLGFGAAAWAQGDYAHDAITAIAPNRHGSPPTGSCTVWANAEGLGVGAAQLDGMHGVTVSINPHPAPGESSPLSFATGLEVAKKEQPKAPAWMFAAIQKSRAAIEAACGKDSATPILVRRLTTKDKG